MTAFATCTTKSDLPSRFLLGGLVAGLSLITGLAAGQSVWLIAVPPLLLGGIAFATYYPVPALIAYLYVLALTPQYVGLDLRPLLPLNASRAVGLLVFTGLTLRVGYSLLFSRKSDSHPLLKYLLFFWLAVSVLPGITVPITLTGQIRASFLFTLDNLAPCFFIAYFIRTEKDQDLLVSNLLLAGAFVAVLGVLEFATGNNLFVNLGPQLPWAEAWTGTLTRGGLPRAEVNFGHPISLGRYFALLIPFAMQRFSTAAAIRKWVLYGLLSSLLALGLVTALSGGPLWGAMLAVAVFLLLSPRNILLPVLSAVGVLILITVFTLPGNAIQDVLGAFFGQNSAAAPDVSANIAGRVMLLDVIQYDLPRSPWFGFGTVDAIPNLLMLVPNGDVVNTYVLYLVQYGVVGLTSFMLILFWCLRSLIVRLRSSQEPQLRIVTIALFAGFLGQALISFGVSPVGVGAQFFWVLIGLIGSNYWVNGRREVDVAAGG
ncbi:MAG: hypothetical protein M1305_00150 [Candidatus Marsarchaeota archaeon]|nr:hypothetical protein [Candidatus Marsarchaeota archaeon]